MAEPNQVAAPPRTARHPGRDRVPRDLVLPVLLAVGSAALLLPVLGPIAESVGVDFSTGQRVAAVIIVVVQSLVLVLRRSRPGICLALVVGGQLALTAVLPDQTNLRLIAPLVAAYTVGLLLPVRRTVRWVGAAVLVEALGGYVVAVEVAPVLRAGLGDDSGAGAEVRPALWLLSALFLLLYYLAAALAGVLTATRRDNVRLGRERSAAALAEQAARTDLAARSERSRMARELHDIAAHHLSGLVVQASAADRLIEKDPAAARELVRSIRAEGKEALGNLRLVVGVLRDTNRDDATGDDPAAGGAAGYSEAVVGLSLAAVDRLIAQAHRLGDRATLEIDGEAYAIGPVAEVTAYRVLQEALTNARRHAQGAPVHVVLAYGRNALRLEVTNGPSRPVVAGPGLGVGAEPPAPTGFGLLGMRERAGLIGARVAAGPTADGGWRVTLEVPVHRPDGESADGA